MMRLSKDSLEPTIEFFIFNKLMLSEYAVKTYCANELLTWNRLDLAFKLAYLDLKGANSTLANKIYQEDIRSQTLGSFEEFGNEEKNSFQKYVDEFEATYENIKTSGFDEKKSIIPLSAAGTIINGAHRVASAIHLKESVNCIHTELPIMTCDYNYFHERNVSPALLDLVVNKFIEYADNVYITFLWPSGKTNFSETLAEFPDVIYKKEVFLSSNGGFNLIVELYKHMDWVGTAESGFAGAKQKLIECFPNFESFFVIAFQSDSFEEVQKIKARVRKINNIGFSSVHITDTKEEAMRISKLVFNENGRHFLNFSQPFKYSIVEKLNVFDEFLFSMHLNKDDVLIDGSVVLALYGIRKNADIDFLTSSQYCTASDDKEFEDHDSELIYHNVEKQSLIYNPAYYFEYLGFKIISFYQFYEMKSSRNEEKDKNDIKLMKALIDNNKFKQLTARVRQSVFYFKIKSKKVVLDVAFKILHFTGLHGVVRGFYRKLKSRT